MTRAKPKPASPRDAWDDAADRARRLDPTLKERHLAIALQWLRAHPQHEWIDGPTATLVRDTARIVAAHEPR